ncbi:hypothetical protein CFP56_006752 [Quercus suber]|uniref:Secreted protein n=1 Tax=Quercus suber TaxID=58331 RepID=A0AAW0L7L1_QUESU
MTRSTKVHSLCSVLRASLFAYSASSQLNDHDWYFWFPLYACACVVLHFHPPHTVSLSQTIVSKVVVELMVSRGMAIGLAMKLMCIG